MALNLAEAIGRSEKAPDLTNTFVKIGEAADRRKAAAEKAKADRAAKDDEDFQKLYKDIHVDPSKYHRVLIPQVQKETADAWKNVMNLHTKDPSNYKWGAIDAIQGLQNKLMYYQGLSKNYNDVEKIPANQQTAPQKEATRILGSGTWDDLKKMQPDQLGSLAVGDDASLKVGWTVPVDKNHTQEAQTLLKGLASQQPEVPILSKSYDVGGKQYQYTEGVKTLGEPEAAAHLAQYYTSNPALKYQLREANRQRLANGEVKDENGNPVSPQDTDAADKALFSEWAKSTSANSREQRRLLSPLTPYAPQRETQADKKKKWEVSGNTYKDGTNVWHYDRTPSGDETYTFSKVNPSDNAVMTFEGGVKGVPVRMEKKNDGSTPDIIVEAQEKTPLYNTDGSEQKDAMGNTKYQTTTVEKKIPYSKYNASKIQNEYGKQLFEVRQAVTGSLDQGTGGATGSVKDRTATSTKSSNGTTTKETKSADAVQKSSAAPAKEIAVTQADVDAKAKQFGMTTDAYIEKIKKGGVNITIKATAAPKKASRPVKRNFTEEEINSSK